VILRALFWLVRILFILFIIRLALRMLFPPAPQRRPGARSGRTSREPERLGGTLVRDPQCGTYIPQDSAHRVQSGGETVYFCSTTCRDAWLAAQPSSGARRA
jgi:YHS domain-containing protein